MAAGGLLRDDAGDPVALYIHTVYTAGMFEWDEAKRRRTLADRGLDFADARPLFDGRPVASVAARTETEARTLTTGPLKDGKFYTVVWTWRGEARRIISFRRARDAEARRHVEAHPGGWLGDVAPDHPDRG
jgi:uncharacterized DUF497 family protein